MKFLRGKKTYIISLLIILQSTVELLTGGMTLSEFVQSPELITLLEGMGLASLRAGVAKEGLKSY